MWKFNSGHFHRRSKGIYYFSPKKTITQLTFFKYEFHSGGISVYLCSSRQLHCSRGSSRLLLFVNVITSVCCYAKTFFIFVGIYRKCSGSFLKKTNAYIINVFIGTSLVRMRSHQTGTTLKNANSEHGLGLNLPPAAFKCNLTCQTLAAYKWTPLVGLGLNNSRPRIKYLFHSFAYKIGCRYCERFR